MADPRDLSKRGDDSFGGGNVPIPVPGAPGTPGVSGPISIPPIQTNVDENYKKTIQALFPYLSPEDQVVQGAVYGIAPLAQPTPGEQITGETRSKYMSRNRAVQALGALQAAGFTPENASPGLKFLGDTLLLLAKYGGKEGEQGMSRENYALFSSQLNNLMEQSKDVEGVSPYASLAKMFINPTFTGGELMPAKTVNGEIVFGTPNKGLYT